MKPYFLITLVAISFLTILHRADGAEEKSLIKPKKNEVTSGILINDSLKKLMEVDGVNAIYKSCESAHAATKDTEKILDCLWRGVSADTDMKKKVQEVYANELKPASTKPQNGRAPAADTNTKLTMIARKTSVDVDYESDPVVIGLSEFYGKKLDKILDPNEALTKEENKNGVILAVDHSQFIEIYKSELGKTIISALTSYCLDTAPTTCSPSSDPKMKWDCSSATFTIDENPVIRKDNRSDNLKSLKQGSLDNGSQDSAKWLSCIKSVPESCNEDGNKNKTINDETFKRSCLVMDYIKAARKNIMVADEQKKFYDDLRKNQTTSIVSNTRELTDLKKISSDAILEITSADVKNSLKKPLDSSKAELESCYKNNAIVNIAACKKFLNTNKDENTTAMAEFGLREIAHEGVLEDELKSDQRVRDYLKEEGYTDPEVASMTANEKDLKTTKDEILARYKAQKLAIVKEMASRIEKKTATNDGKIDPKDDLAKLSDIKTEMESRSTDLENLVYFNNIVSSYLTTTDGSNKSARNTASLYAEAESLEEKDGKILKQQIKDAELSDQRGSSNSVNLEVDKINENFLNYSTQKTKKD